MEGRLLSLSLLILFLFLSVGNFVCAQLEYDASNGRQSNSHEPLASPTASVTQSVHNEQYSSTQATLDGAQAVESALSLLHPLGTSADTHAAHKGSGVLGSAVQYAKELLPRWSISGPSQTSEKRKEQTHLSRRLLSEGVALLQEAANQKNPDAMFLLAEMNFYGNFSHPRNYSEAFRRYKDLSALDSNSSAQHMVGFMHATGLGNAVERDQAKALLYHTFAAEAGNIKSQMTVAYRYYTGIGTPRNCDRAAAYYKKVADQAIQWYRSGPPGGRTWSVDSFHLADADGGVYGEGASVSSAGINAQKAGPGSDAHASLDDVLEYLELMSGKGDYKATFSLGRIHYEGQKGLKRDYKAARKYFLIVANHYWKKGSASSEKPEKQDLEKLACKAAGYLGRMHLRGEGMEENYKHAKKWFDRGSKGGDAGSNNGLGLMYQHGLGVKKDLVQAADRFRAAADHDHPSAQVSLGAMYLDQGSPEDIGFATMLFELAKRYGHIEAYYYLAELANQGIGRERNCGTATAYYKLVAERAEPLLSSFAEANRAYESGDYELAMIDYLLNAEQGYEKAQANVAYLLDEQKSVLGLPAPSIHRKPNPSLLKDPQLALIYWTRSAKQSNTDAMVKMGDYYLNGIGTDPDMEKAASCYTAASEYHQSAQALYNLGWMHENGLGLTQDFHLAKRYYDQALEVNHEAYLPVTLSLFKLRARSAWNTLTNGRINSIRDEPVERKKWSLRDWIHNFLQEDNMQYEDYGDLEDDSYPTTSTITGDDDELFGDDIDDGVVESFVIILLAAALIWLVYYRQQRQLAHRREEEIARAQRLGQPPPEGLAQPPEGGLFPPIGDPGFAQWVAGGIGH